MAEIVYWLGDAAETTAEVCLRADTLGTYDVTCNGQTNSVALDPATDYGVGKPAPFSGLLPNKSYPFRITLAGVEQAAGTLRTMPGADDSFYVGFGSCMVDSADPLVLNTLVRQYDIRAFFSLGDMPYLDSAMEDYLVAAALLGVYTDPTNINLWHEQFLALQRDYPSYRYMAERVPVYRMWDDHESVGNDFDHNLTNTNTQPWSTPFATQAAVDAAFLLARTANDVWALGNPACDWPGAAPWKPSSAAAGTPLANYPARYYSKQIGAATFHHLDCISHRCKEDKADSGKLIEDVDTAKTMLGQPQKMGLKAKLMTSQTAFNPIMSGKLTWRGSTTFDNEGWSDFITERADLIQWIGQFGRGVVWCSGDVHTPLIINSEVHACVNAAPIGQAQQSGSGSPNLGVGYLENVAWKSTGYNEDPLFGTPRAAGLIHVTPTYLDYVIVSDQGLELTRWRQQRGANTLRKLF